MAGTVIRKKTGKKDARGWYEDRDKSVRKILIELPLDVHKKLKMYTVEHDLKIPESACEIITKFFENR